MNNKISTETPAAEGVGYIKSGRPILHLPETGNDGVARAGDKVAQCEDSVALRDVVAAAAAEALPLNMSEEVSTEDASTSSSAPNPNNVPPPKTALALAIDGLTALGEQSDKMVSEKWSKRAAPLLKESLSFLVAYEAASEDEKKAVRKTLKAKSGVSREPNVDNLPVIAVYMGVSCIGVKRTKAQRKEWCRFAVVVKVAANASIKPEDAAQWLEKKTLNSILADWRNMQKAAGNRARKTAVPKALKNYTHLAAALTKGSKFLVLANEELAKADATLAEAMSKVSAESSANGSAASAEVAANA